MKTPELHTGYHNAPLMRGFVLLGNGQSPPQIRQQFSRWLCLHYR